MRVIKPSFNLERVFQSELLISVSDSKSDDSGYGRVSICLLFQCFPATLFPCFVTVASPSHIGEGVWQIFEPAVINFKPQYQVIIHSWQ